MNRFRCISHIPTIPSLPCVFLLRWLELQKLCMTVLFQMFTDHILMADVQLRMYVSTSILICISQNNSFSINREMSLWISSNSAFQSRTVWPSEPVSSARAGSDTTTAAYWLSILAWFINNVKHRGAWWGPFTILQHLSNLLYLYSQHWYDIWQAPV